MEIYDFFSIQELIQPTMHPLKKWDYVSTSIQQQWICGLVAWYILKEKEEKDSNRQESHMSVPSVYCDQDDHLMGFKWPPWTSLLVSFFLLRRKKWISNPHAGNLFASQNSYSASSIAATMHHPAVPYLATSPTTLVALQHVFFSSWLRHIERFEVFWNGESREVKLYRVSINIWRSG